MKKLNKRLLAALIAVVMMFAASIPAFAESYCGCDSPDESDVGGYEDFSHYNSNAHVILVYDVYRCDHCGTFSPVVVNSYAESHTNIPVSTVIDWVNNTETTTYECSAGCGYSYSVTSER